LWVIVGVWAALVAAPASADWTESWTGGTTANPWVIYDEMGPTHLPDFTAISLDNDNLQMLGSSPNDPFVIGVVGLPDTNPQYAITDVRVRATVSSPMTMNFQGQPSRGNNDTFVITRVTPDGTSGYLLALDFQSGEVDFVRSDNADIVEFSASGNVPNFNPAGSYVLELTAEGSNFTGRVFDGGNPVVTVTASDTMYSSGWSGVGTAINTNEALGLSRTPVAVIFDDISATNTVQPPDFDLNNDGQVNKGDVAEFVTFYGTTGAAGAPADFNRDQVVGLRDLQLLQGELGVPGSPSAVPEPSTWFICLAAVVGMVVWRRRM
jgi:hypothetical protein